ncbi:WhiB family transcriptional regulator [Streptomyces sp. NPDC091272]|uniref:WhiB family transcriptional regulator n=1 Tax=Streptomyces sp. NPDC091272 TaxID=3365981 RepID=UPI0038055927
MSRIPKVPRRIAEDRRWQREALCVDADPEVFFPVGASETADTEELRAKRICAQCAVRLRCRQWAMDHKVPEGIWGGLSARERRALAARLRASR